MDWKKLTSCLLVCWAMLGVPSLCLSGELAHACEHDSAPMECQHEQTCAGDPCEDVVIRGARTGELELAAAAVMVSAHNVVPPPAREGVASLALSIESPPGVNLPFPTSDVPLLI
ncbi:MAG: hypothetical protein V3T70_06605 [Phycisphaerae bacterium]